MPLKMNFQLFVRYSTYFLSYRVKVPLNKEAWLWKIAKSLIFTGRKIPMP